MTKTRVLIVAGALLSLALAGCRSAQTTSAILYIEEQRYDKAVKVLHEALEYNPEEADAFFYLGEAHSKLAEEAIGEDKFAVAKQNYEMAYRYYNRAKELDPAKFTENVDLALLHNFTLRSNDGKNEYSGRYYEAAEGFFRLAYAALPDSISPIKNIARMKMQQASEKDNDPVLLGEALELLDQVLAQRPDAFELKIDKANALGRLGRTSEASAIYDELLLEHPNDTALLIDIANLAVTEQKFERAADLYIQLINILEKDENLENDEQVKNMMVQAAAWLAEQDVHRYPEAIDLYKRALQKELLPEQATLFGRLRAHFDYGTALKKEAEAEADPARKGELSGQARAQFSEAVAVGNALVEQYFDNAYGYYYLALCQNELGDLTAAEANMKKFSELQGTGGGQ